MAAWTNILNSALLVGKKITSSIGMALRDNIIAVAEDATGAPKIKRRIRGGASTTDVTITGIGEYGGAELDITLTTGGSAGTYSLMVEFSNDGTTWLPGVLFYTTTTVSLSHSLRLWVDFDSAAYSLISGPSLTTGTATGASLAAVSMRVRASANSFSFAVKATLNGGLT